MAEKDGNMHYTGGGLLERGNYVVYYLELK